MVYLIKSEIRNGTLFKIGFTKNIDVRIQQYYTHNANAKLLETITTYKKTKRDLENELHEELKAMGYKFEQSENGTATEWFFIPIEKEKEFEQNGLAQFKSCKNRKILKAE